jgi:hypothetical protein
MICDDAAEYVSALCSGETIPPTAAQHIANCPTCQARLADYLALGAELRRTASLGLADAVPARTWSKPRNRLATWWQKGWETMRIPRLAFAVLIAGILALASALAVDKVRAHDSGTVVLLHTTGPDGLNADCPLSTQDKDKDVCRLVGEFGPRFLGYKIQLLSRNGNRVLLAIRTLTYSVTPGVRVFNPVELEAAPAKEVWLEPGEPVKFEVEKFGILTIKGDWLDHMPILVAGRVPDLSPGQGELRLVSPLLLKGKNVAGDVGANQISITGPNAVEAYIPGVGRFLLSHMPIKGAVEAHVNWNRLSFEEDGRSWEFISGAPVSRTDKIWVLHQPDFKPSEGIDPDRASLDMQALQQVQPGVWVPKKRTN